ncbi:Ankyrin repeat protein [Ceratocystis lukuohia]|uniref:Ankyrin repeat protein n=1 Tax=Ceratocystis lukuohia TaxID=2019550 RepID=A0ABR4MD32_9PEZI
MPDKKDKKGLRKFMSKLSGYRPHRHPDNTQAQAQAQVQAQTQAPDNGLQYADPSRQFTGADSLYQWPSHIHSSTTSEFSPLPQHTSYQPEPSLDPGMVGSLDTSYTTSAFNHGPSQHRRHRSSHTVSPLSSDRSSHRHLSYQSAHANASSTHRPSHESGSNSSAQAWGQDRMPDIHQLCKMCVSSSHNKTSTAILRILREARSAEWNTTLQTCALATAQSDNIALMQELCELGASIGPEIRGENHETVLHIAAKKGQLLMVEWLIEHGAALGARDYGGLTADQTASNHGQRRCAVIIADARGMPYEPCMLPSTLLPVGFNLLYVFQN